MIQRVYFTRSGRSADCAHSRKCNSQPYPPPNGHWGTPFRVCKDAACSPAGGKIMAGNFIFIKRLQKRAGRSPGGGPGNTSCDGMRRNAFTELAKHGPIGQFWSAIANRAHLASQSPQAAAC